MCLGWSLGVRGGGLSVRGGVCVSGVESECQGWGLSVRGVVYVSGGGVWAGSRDGPDQ